jgi:hypothetical protein
MSTPPKKFTTVETTHALSPTMPGITPSVSADLHARANVCKPRTYASHSFTVWDINWMGAHGSEYPAESRLGGHRFLCPVPNIVGDNACVVSTGNLCDWMGFGWGHMGPNIRRNRVCGDAVFCAPRRTSHQSQIHRPKNVQHPTKFIIVKTTHALSPPIPDSPPQKMSDIPQIHYRRDNARVVSNDARHYPQRFRGPTRTRKRLQTPDVRIPFIHRVGY